MGKRSSDRFLDAPADLIIANCNKQVALSAEPTSYTEANATYALADVAMSSGDFTKANGDSSGRKCTIAAKSGVPVDVSGTVTHAALLDTSNSQVDEVNTTASQAVAAGGTVDIGSWKFEFGDPA